jgi:hypothetical protein
VEKLTALQQDLSTPADDRAEERLAGLLLTSIALAATQGGSVDLSASEVLTIQFSHPIAMPAM